MAIVKVQVFASAKKSGVSKNGPWEMDVVQAGLIDEKGEVSEVGELILPKGHPAVARGFYLPVLEVTRNFEGRIGARISSLTPVPSVKS